MSNLEEKIDNLTLSTSSSDADTTSSEDSSSEEGTWAPFSLFVLNIYTYQKSRFLLRCGTSISATQKSVRDVNWPV
jgi:hypothetical protein